MTTRDLMSSEWELYQLNTRPLLRSVSALIIVISAMVMMNGCSHLFRPPEDDARARMLLEHLLQNNSALTQYKGLAGIHMRMNGMSQSGRVAFAAVRPDKMRVEVLNMLGTPLTTLTGDGDTVTILSHDDHKQYRFRQTRTALARLIEIPIGIEDLQNLLAGRVPVPPHVSVQSLPGRPDASDVILVLKNRWNGVVGRLQMDQTTHDAKSLRVLDYNGELEYRILWLQWKKVGRYRVPSKLVIESPAKQKLTLTMDRYWPNAKVAPATFVLEATGNNQS
jgi:outer membrane biogenesis lipoprotein LolB